MPRKTDPESIAPYLRDASNFSGGSADEVVIPENFDHLVSFLKSNDSPLTIAGAGTGVTASRIPLSGKALSLERFTDIGMAGNSAVQAGAAVSLAELQKFLLQTSSFYPPNPTETLASIGGTLATNASGSRSYKYGSTRDFVLEAQIVLSDGRHALVKRGQKINEPLTFDDGSRIPFPDVNYISPACKNAAGYFVRPGMDWLDLFIGSEGTLAIFTEVKLNLLPAPADFLSGILFFNEEESCWRLVEKLRNHKQNEISPCSLEYFDHCSLEKLRAQFTGMPLASGAALFFEQAIMDAEEYDRVLEIWYDFLSGEELLLEDSWFSQGPRDLRKFHDFRHRLPLLLNEENSRSGRVKIGTDMAAPDEYFMEMMRFYRKTLSASGLESVTFGHIGDNHLHINLLPGIDEMDLARDTYEVLVNQILAWGGTVSAEHGIGKMKNEYFCRMVGEPALDEMRAIKKLFDPGSLLGIGNLF